ncbi:PEP-CTERM system histidine kinase PrsK [Halieaceae bacterium IMCC14734]|uniref:histidine kinase n=1 Tax=Candidatus Litorirhabdus singularis TaxID=2518993 RepID=A0ABT3TG49_9GAMM|nr:XrtA/PEP-CTERM system histidine kinase PrsK [Candidatus Litorirhabdus singularis]MCX2981281.1 PEP-CTERM system histidine kinase PrsK [Candidatus Litorirhabdus singularis]
MTYSIGLYGYLFAAVSYFILTALFLVTWRGKIFATLVIFASVSTVVWTAMMAAAYWSQAVPLVVMDFFELCRSISWCLLLLRIFELRGDEETTRYSSLLLLFAALVLSLLVLLPYFVSAFPFIGWINITAKPAVWLSVAIVSLVLVEQIFRNSSNDERWAIKYMCVGLGIVFAFDFYLYAEALLLGHVNPFLVSIRGIVSALAAPLIAVSVARNPSWDLRIHVSRQVVFHSFTLMAAGVYLLAMSLFGYLIRYFGGSWGGVVQVMFLCTSGIVLVVMLFSDRIRAKIRVLLSKHFFSFKYDYRDEWSNFTRNLAGAVDNVPARVITSVAGLVNSTGGRLWVKQESGRYEFVEQWQAGASISLSENELDNIARFIQGTGWVIDLEEYRSQPGIYENLTIPQKLLDDPRFWLIVPLIFDEEPLGLLLLLEPDTSMSINWEDRDLLKVAGQQAAMHLAQYHANRALVQARQFEAFNRLSAYVVHDLKNILAQQSLIVSNAEKHKHNPVFVDDVIKTVRNSVDRMSRLMEQMRSGIRGSSPRALNLAELLGDIVERCAAREPSPSLKIIDAALVVEADAEQLSTVFSHIIQNAQEASLKDQPIEVTLLAGQHQAIVLVEDHGQGMEAEFIENRLFKPFDSTKGLTGMGVGAFESREYIRSLGGDISVNSDLGLGSIFTIVIPCAEDSEDISL